MVESGSLVLCPVKKLVQSAASVISTTELVLNAFSFPFGGADDRTTQIIVKSINRLESNA